MQQLNTVLWFWLSCALITIGLAVVLKEKQLNVNLLSNETAGKCLGADNETTAITDVDAVSQVLIRSGHHLALQLFQTLCKFESRSDSPGLIFSPSSIWSTLMVTYLGSKGATEAELKKRLRLGGISKSSLAIAYQAMQTWQQLKGTQSTDKQTFVASANKLFVADHLLLNQCFRDMFPNMIEPKDFSKHPEKSLQEINAWVRNQTAGVIEDLLASGSINSLTKMVIANAVYFKSLWAHKFDSAKTEKATFMVSPTEKLQVNMMQLDSVNLLYGVSEALQATAVEMPYSNPEYSMVVILPDTSKSLDSLLRELTVEKLDELLHSLVDDDVDLRLPKFTAQQEFELAGALYSMGFRKIFDPRFIDFTTIFAGLDAKHGVALDSVVHKTHIKVNEEGTEAAAATALIFARSGRPAFATQFVANRPFLYLVRDTSSNTILFMGTVRRPQSEH